MKLVIQRVASASVRVDREVVGSIGRGFLVLVGLETGDDHDAVARAARKVSSLRVFEDAHGRMNRGLDEVGGEVLAVSQFTLAGSIRKGRRPSFDRAMRGDTAQSLFDDFVAQLEASGCRVATGRFGAMMQVALVNDGPVTLIWDDPPDPDS